MRVNQERTGSRKQQTRLMRVLKGFPKRAKGCPSYALSFGESWRDLGDKDSEKDVSKKEMGREEHMMCIKVWETH